MATTDKMGIPYPASTDYVTDGATNMQDIAEQVDLKTGLIKITPTSVSGTGTSIAANGDVIVSSGSTTVQINGVFSADFVNYKIVISEYSGASGNNPAVSMGTAKTGSSHKWAGFFISSAGAFTGQGSSGTDSFNCPIVTRGTSDYAGGEITLFNPFLAQDTAFTCLGNDSDNAAIGRYMTGRHVANTSYTDFLITTAGNINTMRISIYGYN